MWTSSVPELSLLGTLYKGWTKARVFILVFRPFCGLSEHTFLPDSLNVDKSQCPQNMSNKYTFTQEKLKPRSTFNPGLVIIAFRTTQPRIICMRMLKTNQSKTTQEIDHFRVAFFLRVKTNLCAKPLIWRYFSLHVYFHANQTHFHVKSFALRPVLKQRIITTTTTTFI